MKEAVIIRIEIDLTQERPLKMERMPVLRESGKIIWVAKKRKRKPFANAPQGSYSDTVEMQLNHKDIGAVDIMNHGTYAVCYTGCREDEDLEQVLRLRILDMMDRLSGRLQLLAMRLDRVEDEEIFQEGSEAR